MCVYIYIYIYISHLDKAKVLYTPKEIYLPYGVPALLDCHFRSNPPLTNLRWEKDGFLFDPYNVQVRNTIYKIKAIKRKSNYNYSRVYFISTTEVYTSAKWMNPMLAVTRAHRTMNWGLKGPHL